MKKKRFVRDFDYWIDEYMYNCRSRKLRPNRAAMFPCEIMVLLYFPYVLYCFYKN